MKITILGCVAVALAMMGVAPATAAVELVKNGDFSVTSAKTSQQGASDDGKTQYVDGWTTTGYNFIIMKDATVKGSIKTNDNPDMSFWGKYSDAADAKSNGFTDSSSIKGSGGNYLAADGAYGVGLIYQVVSGLEVGQQYDLTFNWAAAQQYGFDGPTTENWTAYFGTDSSHYDSFTTNTVTTPEHGFAPWTTATATFTATNATEFLGFLAKGTPDGKPPFSLIDDVSLKAHPIKVAAVPETSTWAMMVIGFGMMGAGMRRRRIQVSAA